MIVLDKLTILKKHATTQQYLLLDSLTHMQTYLPEGVYEYISSKAENVNMKSLKENYANVARIS